MLYRQHNNRYYFADIFLQRFIDFIWKTKFFDFEMIFDEKKYIWI